MVSAPVDRYQCGNQKRIGSGNKRFYGFIRYKSSSAETQGRSVGWGKTAAKVFKNGQERPWDTALNEPDPRILVLDWVQKNIFVPNQRPGSKCNSLLSWSSYTKEFTLQRFLGEELSIFQGKWAPKCNLPVSFYPLAALRRKFNKFTNFRGRETFSCTCLTSMPSRHVKSTT